MSDGDHTLKLRPLWLAVGWSGVVTMVWLSLTASPPAVDFHYSDKVGHLVAYAGAMGWFSQIYRRRATRLRFAVGFVLMGIALEVLQGVSGLRQFELADMAANATGVLLAWWLANRGVDVVLVHLERRLIRA